MGKMGFFRRIRDSKEDLPRDIRRDLLPRFKALKVGKITPIQCQRLVDDLKDKGLALATITKTKNVLNSIMEYCYKMEIIERNPVDRIIMPKIKNNQNNIHFFTEEQSIRFLSSLDNPTFYQIPEHSRIVKGNAYTVQEYNVVKNASFQWKVYFSLAIMGGFRRGEMLALTWRDIDAENGFISVNKAVADTETGQVIKEPKTHAGNRLVAMPSVVFPMLEKWKKEMIEIRDSLGSSWKGQPKENFDNQYIFIQYTGEMMNLHTPTHKFKEAIQAYNKTASEDMKLPSIRLHDLRHTYGSILGASGVNPNTISAQMGHATVNITLNRYCHALPSQNAIVAHTLENVFQQ